MKSFITLLLTVCSGCLFAQDSLHVALKKQMIADWQRAKIYTSQYLEAMPADKYSFKPVDSVRSFADQMLHFARSNAGFGFIATGISTGLGQPFIDLSFGRSPASQTKDSVMYYVNTSYDIIIDDIKKLDVSKLTEFVSWNLGPNKRTTTRLGWLMKAFEHQTHHRGQCTVYLRLVGARPPNELLWDN